MGLEQRVENSLLGSECMCWGAAPRGAAAGGDDHSHPQPSLGTSGRWGIVQAVAAGPEAGGHGMVLGWVFGRV